MTLVLRITLLLIEYASFLGVVLVSLSDSQSTLSAPGSPSVLTTLLDIPIHSSRRLFGDILALTSAFFYAFYVVFLKVQVKTESRIDMQLFLGFVGLFDLLTCWTVGMILHWTGVENLSFRGQRYNGLLFLPLYVCSRPLLGKLTHI